MKNNLFMANLLGNLLDNKFNLFGFRFGISAMIDLIPGFGDIFDLLLACYIIWLAIQLRVPNTQIAKMIGNVVISFLIGLLPIIGDAAYIFYRPNLRNIRILQKYKNNVIEGEVIK